MKNNVQYNCFVRLFPKTAKYYCGVFGSTSTGSTQTLVARSKLHPKPISELNRLLSTTEASVVDCSMKDDHKKVRKSLKKSIRKKLSEMDTTDTVWMPDIVMTCDEEAFLNLIARIHTTTTTTSQGQARSTLQSEKGMWAPTVPDLERAIHNREVVFVGTTKGIVEAWSRKQ